MAALSLKARLRRYFKNRRAAPRLPAQVEVRLVVLIDDEAASSLKGQTVDLSESGLGMFVTATALKPSSEVLSNDALRLQVRLDLPTGSVELKAIPARHLHVRHEGAEDVYFVGVKIAEINEIDQFRYRGYLLMLQD